MSSKPIIVCIAGMPGSGKSLVANALRDLADLVISMGDVVREEALRRGIKLELNSLMELAKKLREERGPDVIAKEVLKKIKDTNAKIIVVDGVRSLIEINRFKDVGEVYVIAVHSSPRTRLKRLLNRGRVDDPKTSEELLRRDLMELELGLGSVIALADAMIVNEEVNVNELTTSSLNIVKELLKKGPKNN